MKKTIIALFVLCAMVLSMSQVFAAGESALEISKVAAKPGETVGVTVSVKNSPGITAMILTIEYDDTNLTMEKVDFNIEDNNSFKMTSPTLDSGMKITWVNGLKDFEGTWLHATMTFKVSETAPAGEYPVKITGKLDASNTKEELVGFAIQNGSITVSVDSTGLNLSKTDLKLHQGASETLTATVTPPNASQSVSWESDHPNVATVDASGKVTAVSGGAATITATTADGKASATCAVTVEAHTYTGAYQTDAENHWQLCACGDQGPKTPHTFEWVMDKVATVDDTGLKHEECTVCHYKRSENTEIPKHEHILTKTDAKDPTHQEDGNIEYWTCTECGAIFEDQEGTSFITKEKTVVPKIPHTFAPEWSSDESGHFHACECGEKDGLTAHTYGDWEVTQEATASQDGSRKRTCSVCGYEQVETIPADRPVVTPPTPSETQTQPKPSASPEDPPKTGDFAAPALWVCLMAVSGLAAALTLAGKKKRK